MVIKIDMTSIPFKALRKGAETINEYPIKYNKSRIAGSQELTYELHIRGASMPGEKGKFTVTSTDKPRLSENLIHNKIMSSYRWNKVDSYKFKMPNKKSNELDFQIV